jgi:hypothetical protein
MLNFDLPATQTMLVISNYDKPNMAFAFLKLTCLCSWLLIKPLAAVTLSVDTTTGAFCIGDRTEGTNMLYFAAVVQNVSKLFMGCHSDPGFVQVCLR